MTVTEVNDINKFREIINGDEPAIFDFWATWCGPCRVISPIFERLSDSLGSDSKLKFYKVDVDNDRDGEGGGGEAIAREVGIRAMPTFMVFKNGQKIGDLLGARPDQLAALVNAHKA